MMIRRAGIVGGGYGDAGEGMNDEATTDRRTERRKVGGRLSVFEADVIQAVMKRNGNYGGREKLAANRMSR
jgi:hypothetical protein